MEKLSRREEIKVKELVKRVNHRHRFTVPIEYVAQNAEYHGYDTVPMLDSLTVTKLKCETCKEIEIV